MKRLLLSFIFFIVMISIIADPNFVFLSEAEGKNLDLVLAIDTTQSMEENMPSLKHNLVSFLRKCFNYFKEIRVGILYYKDYNEAYLIRAFPFTQDFKMLKKYINGIRPTGGKDIPEAVYAALYNCIHLYKWEAERRLIILVGDAFPHLKQRGKISSEMVQTDAQELEIEIHMIILEK